MGDTADDSGITLNPAFSPLDVDAAAGVDDVVDGVSWDSGITDKPTATSPFVVAVFG